MVLGGLRKEGLILRTKVVINSLINSWETEEEETEETRNRGLIICAVDKNDLGLIFTSCLELKPPETFLRGISKSTDLKESRLKEPTEPSTTQRNLSMSLGGRKLDCNFPI